MAKSNTGKQPDGALPAKSPRETTLNRRFLTEKARITMSSGMNLVLGQTAKDGPTATRRNEQMGVLGPDKATDATAEHGITVSEILVPSGRIVTVFHHWQGEQSSLVLDLHSRRW
uniref:Uncharacterized protein n=1 Tax=Oryza punctata TaxID=4537 RepID=A0A0E0KHC8_ORYPU